MTARFPKIVAVMALCWALACGAGCAVRKGETGSAGPVPGTSLSPAPSPSSAVEPSPYPSAQASVQPSPIGSPSALQEQRDTPLAGSRPPDDTEERGEGLYGPPEADKVAYLTFDDGPSAQTEPILNQLARYGVKATFFVTGKDSESHKALYRRIAAEGHRFGNHTYSHDYSQLYRNPDAFLEDVRKLDRFLEETVGQRMDILRFPGGSNTRLGRRKGSPWIMPELVKRVRAEGYQYFDWNVTSTDAAQAVQPKADIVSSVLSLARGKERIIVLMHDVSAKTTTVEALPEVIRGLQKMGFRFDVLNKNSFTTQFLK